MFALRLRSRLSYSCDFWQRLGFACFSGPDAISKTIEIDESNLRARVATLAPTPSMTSETVISNRYTHTAVIALLAAFMFIISACGEGGAPPAGGSDSAAATPAADAEEVLVEIDLKSRGPHGRRCTGRASDPETRELGLEEHNLLFVVVESDSTVWETEGRLSPGERRTVMLDLEPGMYKAVKSRFVCKSGGSSLAFG